MSAFSPFLARIEGADKADFTLQQPAIIRRKYVYLFPQWGSTNNNFGRDPFLLLRHQHPSFMVAPVFILIFPEHVQPVTEPG